MRNSLTSYKSVPKMLIHLLYILPAWQYHFIKYQVFSAERTMS